MEKKSKVTKFTGALYLFGFFFSNYGLFLLFAEVKIKIKHLPSETFDWQAGKVNYDESIPLKTNRAVSVCGDETVQVC